MDDQAVAERRHFVILMVVDNEDDWMLVKQALAEEEHSNGFETDLHRLEDGVQLLQYLDRCKSGEGPLGPVPDFILIDLNMPAIGGRETLRKVISHPICRRIPSIVFTTSADKAELIECYRCGGTSFAKKLKSSENLRKMVRVIVDHWLCAIQSPGGTPFSCMGYG